VVGIYASWLVYRSARYGERPSRRVLARFLLLVIGAIGLIWFTRGQIGLPTPVLIMGIVGAALALVASQTRFGRHLYATGGNRLAAELAGIRTRTKIRRMYLIMGLLYALTGIILASRLNGASPVGAPFLELDAVSANVIGGVRLGGGVGSVGGAFLGAILLSGVANGLSLMGVETFYQFIASGLILIFAVFLDLRIRHRGA
jgi:D-xylose transport system permease protein